MAAPKTVLLADLPEPVRAAYQNVRAGRAVSGTVARAATDSSSSDSTARFVTDGSKAKRPAVARRMEHAAPCTYHVNDPERTIVFGQSTQGSKQSADATNARALEGERCRRDAEQQLLRKDYLSALDTMQQALRFETTSRNEAFYAWLLHLCTATPGSRVHPRAWQHIESALSREPNNEHAHFYHAMLLKHAAREDDANQVFRRVLRINPNNQDAQREIRLWEMRARPKSNPGLFQRVLGRKD